MVEAWRRLALPRQRRSVGPFGGEGAVESLDLAVLPGAVRADELVAHLVLVEELAETPAVPVGPGVVGHHTFDGDVVGREELDRSSEERCSGVGPFVGVDLAEREAAVVVDDRVDVIEPDGSRAVSVPGGSSKRALPAVDPADLLDVHVDQLAGDPLTFVADRGGLR